MVNFIFISSTQCSSIVFSYSIISFDYSIIFLLIILNVFIYFIFWYNSSFFLCFYVPGFFKEYCRSVPSRNCERIYSNDTHNWSKTKQNFVNFWKTKHVDLAVSNFPFDLNNLITYITFFSRREVGTEFRIL